MMSQLPVLLDTFEECSPQAQCNTLRMVFRVINVLDQSLLSLKVLPIIRLVIEGGYELEVQEEALRCLEKLVNYLSKSEILDNVLPALAAARLEEPSVLMLVARIYEHMLTDKSRYGLSIGVLAKRIMPTMTPYIVSPYLDEDNFVYLSKLLKDMLDEVTKGQSTKLRIEKVNSLDKLIPLMITVDAPTPTTCPLLDDNGLPLSFGASSNQEFNNSNSSRRGSASSEAISKLMRAASTDSSPESEPESSFLMVSAESNMRQRRHSDVAINLPSSATLSRSTSPSPSMTKCSNLDPSPSITRARSSSSLMNPRDRRRHSSVNPHDILRFANKTLDSAAEKLDEASKGATKGLHLGLDTSSMLSSLSPLPSPNSRRGSRRCSVVDFINAAQSGTLLQTQEKKKKKSKSPRKLFKKIGSEMTNLLK